MKYLNDYKIFEGKEEIKYSTWKYVSQTLRKLNITNYTINDDGGVDINGSVDFNSKGLTKLPLKFNRVTNYFDCNYNQLTSLEGCPNYVGTNFYCQGNNLISLEGGPKYVGGNFYCANNKITSLEGCPEHVGGNFYCTGNPIFGGNFYCTGNPIYSIVKYFISRRDKNNLIELFNYYDIVQGMDVIYDRLKFFYEGIDVEVTDKMLDEIRRQGYNIIR